MANFYRVSIIALSLIFTFSVCSFAGPVNKATGDVLRYTYDPYGGRTWSLTFNAHEENLEKKRPAKGSATSEDEFGDGIWEIDVDCVQVGTEKDGALSSYIGGKVTTSFNAPHAPLGSYVMLKVVDRGEPGIKADEVYSAGTKDMGYYAKFCSDPVYYTPKGFWSIQEGNIQVHYQP